MRDISNLSAIRQLRGLIDGASRGLTYAEFKAVAHAIGRLGWFAPAFHHQLLRDVPTETLQAEIDRRCAERGL
jgi:hypothetical protein